MTLKTPWTAAACATVLLLSACGSMTSNDAATQQAQEQAPAQAAATQAKRDADDNKAAKERQQKIVEANQNASSARFVPQNYVTANDGGANVTMRFTKNGRVVWQQNAAEGEKAPAAMNGNWSAKGKQLRVTFYNKAEKKKEVYVFEPKVALLSPAQTNDSCKALTGLLPVDINGTSQGLDNYYFWPQAQVTKNQGTCVAAK